MEITPNVHLIPGTIANLYLVKGDDGLLLVDAGLAGTEKKILAFMAGLGYAPRDLRRIVITHSDGDHTGALAALKAATGAQVYASGIEADAIRAGRVSRELKLKTWQKPLFVVIGQFFKAKPAGVDEIVRDGYMFPVLGGLRVIETPGHTPGHVSLFAPDSGILFCGDSLVVNGGRLRGSTGMNNWDQTKGDASVQAQAALGARIVCSGHGPVLKGNPVPFPEV